MAEWDTQPGEQYGTFTSDTVQDIQKKDRKSITTCILMTGKSGQGKSALINALAGRHGGAGDQVAVEGARANSEYRCTSEVKGYPLVLDGRVSPVTVFDSPGLQDCSTNLDMRNIKERCQQLDLIVYCTKMTNYRLADDDKYSMRTLTQVFGESIWEYSVIALTFANEVDCSRRDDRDEDTGLEPALDDEAGWKALEKQRFEGRLKIREEELKDFLMKEVKVNSEIVKSIPVVPIGDNKTKRGKKDLSLPDRDNWLNIFWERCHLRIKDADTQFHLEINENIMATYRMHIGGGSGSATAESTTRRTSYCEIIVDFFKTIFRRFWFPEEDRNQVH